MRIHREDVSDFPRFALATNQVYTDKTCFIGIGETDELKLVLGILNSKVGRHQLGALVSKMESFISLTALLYCLDMTSI